MQSLHSVRLWAPPLVRVFSPAGQGAQVPVPASGAMLPGAQVWHAVSELPSWYSPAAHSAHEPVVPA